MTRRRRQFSPEFKEEAVRMVLDGERTVASVAREFGINPGTLGSRIGYAHKAAVRNHRGPSLECPRMTGAGCVPQAVTRIRG
ncbi:transposase [Streptosporangium sp. NPDC049644]|uniref:transposase n=1 Tax=unclassified Streptosporangium TaxID=2632669 RepID=UPI003438D96F